MSAESVVIPSPTLNLLCVVIKCCSVKKHTTTTLYKLFLIHFTTLLNTLHFGGKNGR